MLLPRRLFLARGSRLGLRLGDLRSARLDVELELVVDDVHRDLVSGLERAAEHQPRDRALTRSFRDELKEEQMGRQERRWYTPIGVVGHLARALVFLLVGGFVIKAAYEYDAQEAIALDGALRKLAEASYGPVLLSCVAAGLFGYGLFCLVQARYREV
jgi:hypothetical protein